MHSFQYSFNIHTSHIQILRFVRIKQLKERDN
jgi:hypothetical protein